MRIECCLFKASNSSQDSNSFIKFMELLKQKITDIGIGLETSIIIMDNASVHVSKTSKDKIKKMNFQWMTINPYSPSLNPIEKVIGAIKSKWRRKVYDDKIKINAELIQQIAENLLPKTINEWIYKSKKEAINQLKFYLEK